ncbi:hypothetical protein LENED_005152 [Lentinula edodes]|uniref:Uncharacterized protein n=1 Tax=Lentinula edodes TaxID=5353 RepID=A0A1Q3E8D2_LENED|nr:hypothetical protein LENED_005152 [Lentinula edodes]
MFRSLAQLGAKGNSTEKKSISPTLRSDIYTTIDQYKAWLAGTRGQAGDGVSYAPMLHTIQKHFPNVAIGLEALGQIEAEVGVIVGGITNMVLEMSKWEALGGGMAMRTWVDTIVNVLFFDDEGICSKDPNYILSKKPLPKNIWSRERRE